MMFFWAAESLSYAWTMASDPTQDGAQRAVLRVWDCAIMYG